MTYFEKVNIQKTLNMVINLKISHKPNTLFLYFDEYSFKFSLLH